MSEITNQVWNWFETHRRCIDLFHRETWFVRLNEHESSVFLVSPCIVSQWIYLLTSTVFSPQKFWTWIDHIECQDCTPLTFRCFIFCLNILTTRRDVSLSEQCATSLCAYLASIERLRYVLKDFLMLFQKKLSLGTSILSAHGWLTQLYHIPSLCFKLFNIRHRLNPWKAISLAHHSDRLMICITQLWYTEASGNGMRLENLLDKTHSFEVSLHLLAEWTSTLIVQLRHTSPNHFTRYLTCYPQNNATSMSETLHVTPPDGLAFFIYYFTRNILSNEQSLQNLAHLLLSAITLSIKVDKQNFHQHYTLYSQSVFSCIFAKEPKEIHVLSYPRLALFLIHVFLFADSPTSSAEKNTKLWKVLWETFQRNSRYSPYLSILLMDALWMGIIIKESSLSLHWLAGDQTIIKYLETLNKSGWTMKQQLDRLVVIWETIMAASQLQLSSYECLTLTLLRLRGILLTHDVLVKSKSHEKEGFKESFESMAWEQYYVSFQTTQVLDAISSGLSSSVPSRLLGAHALLVVTASILQADSQQNNRVADLFEDCERLEKNTADPNLPGLNEWMSCCLFGSLQYDISWMPHLNETTNVEIDSSNKSELNVIDDSSKLIKSNNFLCSSENNTFQKPIKMYCTDQCLAMDTGEGSMCHVQRAGQIQEQKNTLLELHDPYATFRIVPSTSSLTAIPPTSLRQCLERLSEPLRLTDFQISPKGPANLKDYSTPRTQETYTETFWRVRRALLTIPVIAKNDFEGPSLSPRLLHIILLLEEMITMEDWKELKCNAAVSLCVAWPKETLRTILQTVFDSNLPVSLRLNALECFQKTVRNLSENQGLPRKSKDTTRLNIFIPLAELFFSELLTQFHEYFHLHSKHVISNQTTLEILKEDWNLFLSHIIASFIYILNGAQKSLGIQSMLRQLVYILDISLTSESIFLRRNALSLLGKYFDVIRNKQELCETLTYSRIPWIQRSLSHFMRHDPDGLCRKMSKAMFKSIELLSDP